MSNHNLYRCMICIIIMAIIKLLLADDYGNALVLLVALVPLIQDLRREAQETQEGESE